MGILKCKLVALGDNRYENSHKNIVRQNFCKYFLRKFICTKKFICKPTRHGLSKRETLFGSGNSMGLEYRWSQGPQILKS